MRIAVVTPYFREAAAVLQRCIASVRAQPVAVDHIFVADGHPQYWLEAETRVQHIVLRRSVGDFGDTPRSVGFIVAMRSDYDLVQFLDVDNILLPNHYAEVLGHFDGRAPAAYPDLVVARRHMLRPDGSVLDVALPDDDALSHVDTSCFVFYRTAFDLGLKWSFIPRQLGFMDDRIFSDITLKTGSRKIAVNAVKTVGYLCRWASVYRDAGEEPPPDAKELYGYYAAAQSWWRGLDPLRKRVIERDLGLPIILPPSDDVGPP